MSQEYSLFLSFTILVVICTTLASQIDEDIARTRELHNVYEPLFTANKKIQWAAMSVNNEPAIVTDDPGVSGSMTVARTRTAKGKPKDAMHSEPCVWGVISGKWNSATESYCDANQIGTPPTVIQDGKFKQNDGQEIDITDFLVYTFNSPCPICSNLLSVEMTAALCASRKVVVYRIQFSNDYVELQNFKMLHESKWIVKIDHTGVLQNKFADYANVYPKRSYFNGGPQCFKIIFNYGLRQFADTTSHVDIREADSWKNIDFRGYSDDDGLHEMLTDFFTKEVTGPRSFITIPLDPTGVAVEQRLCSCKAGYRGLLCRNKKEPAQAGPSNSKIRQAPHESRQNTMTESRVKRKIGG